MRLYSIQSKEFINRVLNSKEPIINYDNVDTAGFTFKHPRTKSIYNDEDFIYCFAPLRHDITEGRKIIYHLIFKNLAFFSSWYKLDLKNSVLIEFEVPDNIGIIGEINSTALPSEEDISNLYNLSYDEYLEQNKQDKVFENVLPYINTSWIVAVYDINVSDYLPRNVYEFKPLINKGGILEDTSLFVCNAPAASMEFYNKITHKSVNKFTIKQNKDFTLFKATKEFETFKEYIKLSEENLYKIQYPLHSIQSDKERYNLKALDELITKCG